MCCPAQQRANGPVGLTLRQAAPPCPSGRAEDLDVERVEAVGVGEQLDADGNTSSARPDRDVGGGRLVATVTDSDGNVTGLVQSP